MNQSSPPYNLREFGIELTFHEGRQGMIDAHAMQLLQCILYM